MERAPKIIVGLTFIAVISVGIFDIIKDAQLKCDEAISDWKMALADKELGLSELELAATLGKAPTKAAITRAASNDTEERNEMQKNCSAERYLNALETEAAESLIDRMTD